MSGLAVNDLLQETPNLAARAKVDPGETSRVDLKRTHRDAGPSKIGLRFVASLEFEHPYFTNNCPFFSYIVAKMELGVRAIRNFLKHIRQWPPASLQNNVVNVSQPFL